MRTRTSLIAMSLFSLTLMSCGDNDDEDEDGEGGGSAVVSVDECSSALKWIGGDEESPLMHPGGDCNACHTQEGEGPIYGIVGTVFQGLSEATDCYGLADITVELTDADGTLHTLTTNSAGNFFSETSEASIAMPYTARLVMGDKEAVMVTPQTTANCALCHTADGLNGAPGRIVWPH